ncbi:hypothetical protein L9F63_004263, partial [Diploptera punctata]
PFSVIVTRGREGNDQQVLRNKVMMEELLLMYAERFCGIYSLKTFSKNPLTRNNLLFCRLHCNLGFKIVLPLPKSSLFLTIITKTAGEKQMRNKKIILMLRCLLYNDLNACSHEACVNAGSHLLIHFSTRRKQIICPSSLWTSNITASYDFTHSWKGRRVLCGVSLDSLEKCNI